jgi:hypothetical protein
MSGETAVEVSKVLRNFAPGWVLVIVVAAILAYQSPKLLKELFAGIKALRTSKSQKAS